MARLHIFLFLLVSIAFVSQSEVIQINDQPLATPSSPPPPPQGPPPQGPPPKPPASNHMYANLKNWLRSFDGTGNNAQFANWGSAGQPESRFCPNNYEDGLSVMQSTLPAPRDLSNSLGNVNLIPGGTIQLSRRNWNMIFALWGQFTEHDVSLTKSATTEPVPIVIPSCDQWFDKECTGTQQIPFKRSAFDPNQAVRTQINVNTAWLDGSQIYGSSKVVSDKLRAFQDGKLLTSSGNLLPKDANGFFFAGDVRVNENVGLTSLHIIFLREHNRICDIINSLFKNLSDEQIYQMARNYVIALLQKITYDEYLPALLGRAQFDAWIGNYTYQDNINPDLYTEFNSAAFRIGHTLINSPYHLMDNSGTVLQNLTLGEMFQNPNLITDETLTQLLNGLLRVHAKERSLEIVDDLRNFLVLGAFSTQKIDLFSTNVQRGRDHGLCSFKRARDQMGIADDTFNNIFNAPNSNNDANSKAGRLQSLYTSLDRIDLWVGIIGERALTGSDLGELGGKLVAAQFRKIRNADKLWWENVLAPYPRILDEIANTRLGDVIKRNTGVTTVNLKSFTKVL